MKIGSILAVLFTAQLGRLKSNYAIELYKGKEPSMMGSIENMQIYGFFWTVFYILVWYVSGKSPTVLRIVDLWCTYGILALIDKRARIVPDRILICYLAGQMILGLWSVGFSSTFHTCLTGLAFAALIMAVCWFSQGKMGLGDAKLLGVTAMTAGWIYTLQVLVYGLLLSFLYSMYSLIFRKRSIRSEFPFVPFLAAGMVISEVFLHIL